MNTLEKILQEINEEIKSSIAFSSVFTDGLCRARNIIRKHLQQDNDGWIPVEERMPESTIYDFKWFWITIRSDIGYTYTMKAKWDYRQKCFLYENGRKISRNIIAYKHYYAPEPYKPEKDGDRYENHKKRKTKNKEIFL